MENTQPLLIFAGCIALLLLVNLINHLRSGFARIRYVKMELARATSLNEYRYWKNELHILRWSLLPGLSRYRIKRLQRFFSRRRRGGKYQKSDG